MTTANLESRLTLVTGGTDSNKIRALVPSRPFTQQEGDLLHPPLRTLEA